MSGVRQGEGDGVSSVVGKRLQHKHADEHPREILGRPFGTGPHGISI